MNSLDSLDESHASSQLFVSHLENCVFRASGNLVQLPTGQNLSVLSGMCPTAVGGRWKSSSSFVFQKHKMLDKIHQRMCKDLLNVNTIWDWFIIVLNTTIEYQMRTSLLMFSYLYERDQVSAVRIFSFLVLFSFGFRSIRNLFLFVCFWFGIKEQYMVLFDRYPNIPSHIMSEVHEYLGPHLTATGPHTQMEHPPSGKCSQTKYFWKAPVFSSCHSIVWWCPSLPLWAQQTLWTATMEAPGMDLPHTVLPGMAASVPLCCYPWSFRSHQSSVHCGRMGKRTCLSPLC